MQTKARKYGAYLWLLSPPCEYCTVALWHLWHSSFLQEKAVYGNFKSCFSVAGRIQPCFPSNWAGPGAFGVAAPVPDPTLPPIGVQLNASLCVQKDSLPAVKPPVGCDKHALQFLQSAIRRGPVKVSSLRARWTEFEPNLGKLEQFLQNDSQRFKVVCESVPWIQ